MSTFMRRLVSVIISAGLICAGTYIVYGEMFFRMSGPGSRVFGAGLALVGGGIAWLWFDFLGPIVARRIIEKRAARTKNAPPK
jgi:hypothetical protein